MSLKWGEPSSSFQSTESIGKYEIFKQNMKHLQPLDELLRCRICFEYFNVCMVTRCSHNYCSLCIRRYMTYKAQCPTCFQATSEPELRNNRIVDEILKVYKDFSELLSQGYVIKCPSSEKSSIDLEPVNSLEICSVPSHTALETCSPSDQQLSRDALNEVSCPVCSVPVLSKNINQHLDSCLVQEENKPAVKSEDKRAGLPKVVYHLLSDRDLRKKLKECGLSGFGDRRTLIRRHKNYLILYNAECDSLDPRPVSEILRQVEKEEKEEKTSDTRKKALCFDSKSDPEVIEEQRVLYLKQHSQQFNELVKDIRFRTPQDSPGENSDSAVACLSQCFDKDGSDADQKASTSNLLSENIIDNLSNSEPDCVILEDFASSKDSKTSDTENPLSIEIFAEALEGQSEEKCSEATCNASSSEKHIGHQKSSTQPVLLRKRKIGRNSAKEAGCSHEKK